MQAWARGSSVHLAEERDIQPLSSHLASTHVIFLIHDDGATATIRCSKVFSGDQDYRVPGVMVPLIPGKYRRWQPFITWIALRRVLPDSVIYLLVQASFDVHQLDRVTVNRISSLNLEPRLAGSPQPEPPFPRRHLKDLKLRHVPRS